MLPGMVDIHTHGRCGYGTLGADEASLKEMAREYALVGTTAFLPSLMSAPLEMLKTSIENIAKAQIEPSGARMLGVYLEGRYISNKRKGAHDASHLAPLDVSELEMLVDIYRRSCNSDGSFRVICAPELDGSDEFIKRACALGASVSIGHSDADTEACEHALECGADSFTHLYNAMSPLNHRLCGCVGTALTSDAFAELICDGCHVARDAVRIAYMAKAGDRLVLITDSAPFAGLPDGEYIQENIKFVIRNGAAWLVDGTLIGSVVSLFDAMKKFMEFCGISLEEAIPYATINPAKAIKIDDKLGSLDVGKYADFILINENNKEISRVFVRETEIINTTKEDTANV